MVQTRHISFKDWNPIGKPDWNKSHSSANVKKGTLSNASLNKMNLPQNKDPFGEAATLELSYNYGKETVLSTNTTSVSRATSRTLKVGCKGDDVKALQTNLNKLGYNAGTPDGTYGNGTKNAVISFQKTYGLSPDGDKLVMM